MDAFATYGDLELRLNRTFTTEERTWITALLEDASTYLRDDVIGQQVYPASTSTFTVWPDGGRVDIPQQPLISIDLVSDADGVTLVEGTGYTRRDSTLIFRSDDPVTITFTYGYTLPPDSLKRWACVLVSQALFPLEQNLGLTVGGLSSVQIDDFRAAFADAGEMTGIALSDRNIALLREQFGTRTSYVVTTR